MESIILDNKLVGEISGRFFVPSYQRGYRWGKTEVERMLDDILGSKGQPYCLQPIVLRNHGDFYELIDGQQRLTTLYLLLSYIKREYKPRIQILFSLSYETRQKSEEFLQNIDEGRKDENIDFWFLSEAYKTIDRWFDKEAEQKGINQDDVVADNIFVYLMTSIKVIWYEVPQTEDAHDLFTRLNIGKIPLTSSELVKALFLRSSSNEISERQEEISLQWDNIERDLHDNSLWAFLTNKDVKAYPTRIDLVLDLMAGKTDEDREEYKTFFFFDKLKEETCLSDIWRDILRSFLMLKEWRYEHELYHKIGYLIASGAKSLAEIFNAAKGQRKSEFKQYIDAEIKNSVNFKKEYEALDYKKDAADIERLLLLFNVESVRTLDSGKQWFPFDKHKEASWSLEHIHAQHSEGLKTNDKRLRWLEDHLRAVEDFNGEAHSVLKDKMRKLIDTIKANPKTASVGELFEPIQREVALLFSAEGNEYIHNIGNMALLDCGDNAALSNYVFDAKRQMIIDWDKEGKYIPFCTKMVFFKYYTSAKDNQLNFWGINDRKAYIEAINEKLHDYLKEDINTENA